MNNFNKTIITFSLILFISCSSIYGGSTNSEGNQSLSGTPTEITFESDVGVTSYRSIEFNNRSEDHFEITNLAFVNNGCGAFSVHSITDESGNLLYIAGDLISVSVNSGKTVDIIIRFSPTACETTDYTTTFVIYYEQEEDLNTETVSLVAIVSDSAPDAAVCDEAEVSYYDEFDNPTERKLPALPDGKKYYINVTKMSAYLQTTGGFSSFSTEVGTHINIDTVPEDELFQPAFMPFTTDDDGNLLTDIVDLCVDFSIPTEPTDPYFLGARVHITTESQFSGTIDRTEENAGTIEIPGFTIKLSSFVNNSSSLLQNSDGFFEVNVEIELVTTETEENSFLDELVDVTDDDGEKYLNISNSKLIGKALRHGTVTFVGIGLFLDDDDVKMDDVGVSALINNEAYLFLQLEGLITQVEE